ncbi:signal peptidase I [Brevibacterium album]|uniref:signal peptidase I n=1 Tax=Brevibacterium album TaxID=417948 RepID=UPI000409E277|nr:signal peptidase I [Brevibacterium album]
MPSIGGAADRGARVGATSGSRPRAFSRGPGGPHPEGARDSRDRQARARRLRRLGLLALCVLGLPLVLAGALRGLVVQPFTVPSASMEPALSPGDRIRVWRADGILRTYERGDLVVVDGRGSFIGALPPTAGEQLGSWFGIGPRDVYFVKRVIGVGGDTVECCDARGRLLVGGEPLEEPYLAEPGARASAADFAVEVPAGRVWLMGDNRGDSFDSRDLLGRPGGGMIREERIIGTVMGEG